MKLQPTGMNPTGQFVIGANTDVITGIPMVLAVVPNINFKTVGTTDLYTVPADAAGCVVTDLMIRATTSSGLTVGATGTVGTETTTYANILAAVGLGGVMPVGKIFKALISGNSYSIAQPGEVIKGKITIGAIATGSFICELILIGYLL